MWCKLSGGAAIVALLLVSGCSIVPDLTKLRERAEQGDVKAQNCLGLRFYRGTWVRGDKTEAAKWFRKAAEQGYLKAQFNLGLCYVKGEGVVADVVEAYKWFYLAGLAGDQPARTEYLKLAKVMTTEQVAEAQMRAKQCFQTKGPVQSAKG